MTQSSTPARRPMLQRLAAVTAAGAILPRHVDFASIAIRNVSA
ncbi:MULTISPECIES: hypothetical protein [Burkholderia]|nr:MULTISPECIES: hypothetical protein [Burkholderia]MDN7519844.1 hypothetical protein [Burkholderia sp. AU45251]